MKNSVILFVALSMFSFLVCSQENPPKNVKKEFSLRFASAKSVKWSSEKPDEWEAEFKMNGKKMSACFDSSAVWTTTETVITENDIPEAVRNTLSTEFKEYKRRLMEIFESPEIKGFEFGLRKGEISIEVMIDSAGKVIKKMN